MQEKVNITDEYIDLIVKERKKHNLTAYELSEKIGKNKSWIPNIENKRTKNISREDLFLIFSDFAREENVDVEKYISKNLHLQGNKMQQLETWRNIISELESQSFDIIVGSFHMDKCIRINDVVDIIEKHLLR